MLKFKQFLRSRMLTDRRGVTAVEFALVAPVFLVMLMVFLEVSIITLDQTLLDMVTNSVQRVLVTGNSGGGYTSGTTGQVNNPQTAIETAICQGFIGTFGGNTNGVWPVTPNVPIFPNCTCSKTQTVGGVTSCLYYSFPTVTGFRYCVWTASNFAGAMATGLQAPACPANWSKSTAWSPASSATLMPTGSISVVMRIEYDYSIVTPALNGLGTGKLPLYGISAAQVGL